MFTETQIAHSTIPSITPRRRRLNHFLANRKGGSKGRLGLFWVIWLGSNLSALVAYAFRNGPLEDLNAGCSSPLLKDETLSRITDAKMKKLMINASTKLAAMLEARGSDPEQYRRFVQGYGLLYCRAWKR